MQIFISHSSKDKMIARKISNILRQNKLEVWLDEAEIRVGESIPDKIAEGIELSDVFCIIISSYSAKSSWVRRELNSFMPKFVSSKCVIVPCKLDKVDLPSLIADLKYADFTKNFQTGIEGLLGAVRIREEVMFNAAVQNMKESILFELNNAELAFTLFEIFKKRAFLFIGDRRSDKGPYTLLGKLTSLKVLEKTTDKYEILYSFSPEGARAIKELYSSEFERLKHYIEDDERNNEHNTGEL
jgi:hypothetical protein